MKGQDNSFQLSQCTHKGQHTPCWAKKGGEDKASVK